METFLYFLQTEPFIAGIIIGLFLLILFDSPREQEIIIVRKSPPTSFPKSVAVALILLLFFIWFLDSIEQQAPEGKSPQTEEPAESEKYALALEDISKEEAQKCQRQLGPYYQVKFFEEYGTLLIGVFRTKDDAHRFLRENPSLYMYKPTAVPI